MLEFEIEVIHFDPDDDICYMNERFNSHGTFSCFLDNLKKEIDIDYPDLFGKFNNVFIKCIYSRDLDDLDSQCGYMTLEIIKNDKGLAIKNQIIFDPHNLLEVD